MYTERCLVRRGSTQQGKREWYKSVQNKKSTPPPRRGAAGWAHMGTQMASTHMISGGGYGWLVVVPLTHKGAQVKTGRGEEVGAWQSLRAEYRARARLAELTLPS